MGWFFINLVVPATLPLVILLVLKLVDLPKPYSARSSPLRAVRDGQLGWVAMGFAASCTYDLWGHLHTTSNATPEWAGYVLALSVVFLVLSGYCPWPELYSPSTSRNSNRLGWLTG